jgi:hypothetical protein
MVAPASLRWSPKNLMDKQVQELKVSRKPKLLYAKFVTLLIPVSMLCLVFGHSQDIEWLKRLGWGVNYDALGRGLFWLASLLMFTHMVYLFGMRGRRRLYQWISALMILVLVVLAFWLVPDDINIDRYVMSPPAKDSDTNEATFTRVASYEFWGLRTLPASRFRSNVNYSDREYPAKTKEHESWRGSHNVIYGTTTLTEFRPLSPFDVVGMKTDGVISDEEAQANMLGKGYECLTQINHYVGPFVVRDYVRTMDLSLADMRQQCRLIDVPRGSKAWWSGSPVLPPR